MNPDNAGQAPNRLSPLREERKLQADDQAGAQSPKTVSLDLP
jgi:hypothetical protein